MLASTAEAGTVERVGWLVQAAGATLKEKKRPIKVVGRDGTVKKTIPHVEVIEGLLHHEGISGALEDGRRPKTILCEVCRRVVVVRGTVPRTCKEHGGKKLCPRGCGAAVDKKTISCLDCKTPEERSELKRKMHANRTPEERKFAARGLRSALMNRTPEERRAAAQKGHSSMTPEERSAWARKVSSSVRKTFASKTPEQRSEACRKAWETRRAKAAAK